MRRPAQPSHAAAQARIPRAIPMSTRHCLAFLWIGTNQTRVPRSSLLISVKGPLLAQSGRSLVRHCHLWANLEKQEARTAGLSWQGILELADLRKPTARMAVQYRRPQFHRKSLAAISPFSVFRASPPQAEMAWPEGLHPRLGAEHLVAQIADLVLDLTLLPSRSGRAGHRLDQVM